MKYKPCPICGGERHRTSPTVANPYCFKCAEDRRKQMIDELLTLTRGQTTEERLAYLEELFVHTMSSEDINMRIRIFKCGEEEWWKDLG